jgi:glycosyltransferase involved in cell wall biosynthesis
VTTSAAHPSEAVSVVVPTRDRPELLERAIRTILTQEHDGDIECLVVFDQSEQHDVAVGTDLPAGRSIRLLSNTRTPGLAGARNSGVMAASSGLVAFCDDDDEWLPGKLTAQLELLAARPDSPVVATGILVNYEGRDTARPAPTRALHQGDFLDDRIMEVNPCTALIRRDVMLEQIGLVDETIPGGYGEDYEWLLRASGVGPVCCVPEPLVRVNWHASSFFADRWRTIIDALVYLLDRYPAFEEHPTGLARIEGQIAFAHAGLGDSRAARTWARRALSHRATEKRAYVALACSTSLLGNDTVMRLAHRAGRGI